MYSECYIIENMEILLQKKDQCKQEKMDNIQKMKYRGKLRKSKKFFKMLKFNKVLYLKQKQGRCSKT